jgi:hypothetical protein
MSVPEKKAKEAPRALLIALKVVSLIALSILLIGVVFLVAIFLTPVGLDNPRPDTISLTGTFPVSEDCGTAPGALYLENVSISSVSGSVSTNRVGLKIFPDSGGMPLANVDPPISTSPCPSSGGYYISLSSESGTVMACWSGGSGAWTSPTGSPLACATPVGSNLSSAATLNGGQTLTVYMYGEGNPAGAYQMQAYGINGATVSGAVDL